MGGGTSIGGFGDGEVERPDYDHVPDDLVDLAEEAGIFPDDERLQQLEALGEQEATYGAKARRWRYGAAGAFLSSMAGYLIYHNETTAESMAFNEETEEFKELKDGIVAQRDSLEQARYTPHPDSVVAADNVEIDVQEAAADRVDQIRNYEAAIEAVEDTIVSRDSVYQADDVGEPAVIGNASLVTTLLMGATFLAGMWKQNTYENEKIEHSKDRIAKETELYSQFRKEQRDL